MHGFPLELIIKCDNLYHHAYCFYLVFHVGVKIVSPKAITWVQYLLLMLLPHVNCRLLCSALHWGGIFVFVGLLSTIHWTDLHSCGRLIVIAGWSTRVPASWGVYCLSRLARDWSHVTSIHNFDWLVSLRCRVKRWKIPLWPQMRHHPLAVLPYTSASLPWCEFPFCLNFPRSSKVVTLWFHWSFAADVVLLSDCDNGIHLPIVFYRCCDLLKGFISSCLSWLAHPTSWMGRALWFAFCGK